MPQSLLICKSLLATQRALHLRLYNIVVIYAIGAKLKTVANKI